MGPAPAASNNRNQGKCLGTKPGALHLSTATRAVFTASTRTLRETSLQDCARSGLFGNRETNPDVFHDRWKTTAEFFTHSASRVFTGLFKDQTTERGDITVPDFLNREELDAIATRLHVCAHQWIDTIRPEATTPHGPQERNNLDTVLSRFTDYKTDLAPGAQEGLDFIASLGLDDAPHITTTHSNNHDNEGQAPTDDLEEEQGPEL